MFLPDTVYSNFTGQEMQQTSQNEIPTLNMIEIQFLLPIEMPKRQGLVRPNLLNYNAAIDSLAKRFRWLFAVELFKTLPLQSFIPDIISASSSAS